MVVERGVGLKALTTPYAFVSHFSRLLGDSGDEWGKKWVSHNLLSHLSQKHPGDSPCLVHLSRMISNFSADIKSTSLVVQSAHGSFQSQPQNHFESAFGLAGVAHSGSAVGPSWDKLCHEYNCACGSNGTYLGLLQSINIHSTRETHGGGMVAALLTGPSSSTGNVDKTISGGHMPVQAPNTEAGPSRDQKGGKTPQAPTAKPHSPSSRSSETHESYLQTRIC